MADTTSPTGALLAVSGATTKIEIQFSETLPVSVTSNINVNSIVDTVKYNATKADGTNASTANVSAIKWGKIGGTDSTKDWSTLEITVDNIILTAKRYLIVTFKDIVADAAKNKVGSVSAVINTKKVSVARPTRLKVSTILNKARYILADSSKSRWTDEQLIISLNDALLEIANEGDLFSKSDFFTIKNNAASYNFEAYMLRLHAAEINLRSLKLSTHSDLEDQFGANWKKNKALKVTDITHMVYEDNQPGHFRLYPYPSFTTLDNTVSSSSEAGIITALFYSDLEFKPWIPPATTKRSVAGEVVPPEPDYYLKVFYTAVPEKLTYLEEELDECIPIGLANCLSSYVIKEAYKASAETIDREMSVLWQQNYSYELQKFKLNKKDNYVESSRQTSYRSFQ